MKTACVITSINHPESGSVYAWADIMDEVFLVIDKRTPNFTNSRSNVTVIDEFDKFPMNHYARKNLGYIAAKRAGYDRVFETDDDNFPYADDSDYTNHSSPTCLSRGRWFDAFSYWGIDQVQRGLPLYMDSAQHVLALTSGYEIKCTQFWCDGEPDSWAIERACRTGRVRIRNSNPDVALGCQSFSPVNTQMTLIDLDCLNLMYLPFTCNGRVSDIIRGYRLQQELWKHEATVAFTNRSVFQARNTHDDLRDMKDEWPLMRLWRRQMDIEQWVRSGLCTEQERDLYAEYIDLCP